MARTLRTLGGACTVALLAMAGAGQAAGGASKQAPRTYGPIRSWHGMQIRSLDPIRGRVRAASAGATTTPATAAKPAQHRDQILSNENSFSRWAYVSRIASIYTRATTSSSRITRLHWSTEDGFPEIYLLLRAHWDSSGQEWIRIRIPGRPNGRTGWVKREGLGRLHLTHLLVIVDREHLRISLRSWGRQVWSAPVGVGKPSTPTPAGHFWIRERFKIANPSSGYWPYAFGTADYSTLSDWPGGGIVGIHGPYYQPQLIPGRPSHGCIRLHTGDDAWLAQRMKLGTPLRVI